MSRIIPFNSNQLRLVPSDPGCWLPTDHQVRFFDEMVEQELDISQIIGNPGKHGRLSYDPVMLLKAVLYGYMVGLHSSREIANACVERIDNRWWSDLSKGRRPACSRIGRCRILQRGSH
jgi:transposase